MKTIKRWAVTIGLFLALSPVGQAVEVVKKDNVGLSIDGRAQMFGLAERVNDPHRNDVRLYLFLRQARLKFLGNYEDYKFNVELAFAGEEEVRAPNPGVSLNLLDFYFDIPLWEATHFRVGQFLIPYSRERLSSDAELQFTGRSIHNLAFRMGRDVGAAIHSYPGNFVMGLGVFTGGGRDVPERFLPQDLGTPLFVARLGYNNGVDRDLFAVSQNNLEQEEIGTAFYINGLYLKDSLVGHSTVLNVKTAEKSLLINSNWNPYINRAPLVKGDLGQFGADFALRIPIEKKILSAEAEGNFGLYDNGYGRTHMFGGRGQLGIYQKPVELALAYAFVVPDADFANGGTTVTGGKVFHELTPGATYYLKGHKAKFILDFPLLFDVPTVTEPNVGAYVLTEQPDQAAVLDPKTKGTASREFVAEGRVLFQLAF